MSSFRLSSLALLLCCAAGPATSDPIYGVVKSSDGSPIPHCRVTLKRDSRLTTSTDSLGRFTLGAANETGIGRPLPSSPASDLPYLVGDRLILPSHWLNQDQTSIIATTSSGRTIARITTDASRSGRIVLPNLHRQPGLSLIRIRHNNEAYLIKTLFGTVANAARSQAASASMPPDDHVAHRSLLGTDTLLVSAQRHIPVHFPVDASAQSQTVVLAAFTPDTTNAWGAGIGTHRIAAPNKVTGKIIVVAADLANNSTDDRLAIQNAINSAMPGDEVYLPDGTYNINSYTSTKGNIEMKSGVNLRGQSEKNTILLAKVFGDAVISLAGINNSVLANMTITTPAPDLFLRKGVYVQAGTLPSSNIYIRNISVSNFDDNGIRVSKSHDVVVEYCTVSASTAPDNGYAIEVMGESLVDLSGTDKDTYHILVQNNTVIGPNIRHAIVLQDYVHHNLVRHNVLLNIGLGAFDLHGKGEYANELTGNQVFDGGSEAIGFGNGSTLETGKGNYVNANIIVNAKVGMFVNFNSVDQIVSHNNITGSTSTSSQASGIWVLSGAKNCRIYNNVIRNNNGNPGFWGIKIEAPDAEIKGNTVAGNQNGVWVTTAGRTGLKMSENTIEQNVLVNQKLD